ncbi:glyoxalase/bleomycin resistance protein/dioxygenase superfamily protein [Hypericibacter terrae]|uniref:Glyoxalase/bleomycin resistance protein/dioxygenase superfamily protein n=1 Tax=Hypericibacter terrae TaxID=2602015 RepID=A0A5J6MC06_9PROT|nr:VOC family protein [Hypericibacter terrae]QEX14754.1 glyoxalase/bleomycin resistance protein/dioxygenase superfamily protein [Hypericibacter terrae]
MTMPPFHLAFPVADLDRTRHFYEGMLGCRVGRTDPLWIDFDFFGHQISAHLRPEETAMARTNTVDGDNVPVRHFGAILDWDDWHRLADKLKGSKARFIIEPHVRFKGEVGEQATFFILDPSGNALEFKSFRDMSRVFATQP